MTTVKIVFKKNTRLFDIEQETAGYILPTKEGEPYYFWWSDLTFSFYPYDVVEAVRLEEVEEDGTVPDPEVSDM